MSSVWRDAILLIGILANTVSIAVGIRSLRHRLNSHLQDHMGINAKLDKLIRAKDGNNVARD